MPTLRTIEESLLQNLDDDLKDSLRASGVVPVNDKYTQLYDLPAGTNTVVLIGGRGGAKTTEASRYIALQGTVNRKRCVVLRDEKELIRESILNEILLRFDELNPYWRFTKDFDRLDTGIKDRGTGEMIVFTKGFRASDSKKRANLKSISNIDIAVIEEAEDIRDVDKFNTFSDSIRKDGALIIIILNTPDVGHWVIKRYFNTEPIISPDDKVSDGYYKITPKQIPGFCCIQTSYEDNPHLPQHIVDKYRGYGDPEHHLYNEHHYLTAIKGYASVGRRGQVLKKVKPIKLADYLALPFKEFYGQDFGTASPAGMVGVKFDKNNCYCRQLNYLPMNTLSIGRRYCELKLTGGDRIVADCADEKAWRKLRKGFSKEDVPAEVLQKYPALLQGFNIVPCVKGPDSVRFGLDLMDSMNLFAVEESLDLWEEIRNRIYGQDKYGNYTNDPEEGFDHLQDPWMYVVNDQRGKKKFAISTE